MGELAGILGIISAFVTPINLFLIFYIVWEFIQLNECLSIYVWAARYCVYTSMFDWQNYYKGKLTPDEILELKAWEYHHVRDRNGHYYSRRTLIRYLKRHQDSEHISIFGLQSRSDGKEIGEEKLRNE